ncbi:hypothetical protein F5Y14DRAFT_433754 [Nemania sp. NC0429]|nr:hypothetical protein F5Y14DRAFT_433754 [Nemania sp. NC0429]
MTTSWVGVFEVLLLCLGKVVARHSRRATSYQCPSLYNFAYGSQLRKHVQGLKHKRPCFRSRERGIVTGRGMLRNDWGHSVSSSGHLDEHHDFPTTWTRHGIFIRADGDKDWVYRPCPWVGHRNFFLPVVQKA